MPFADYKDFNDCVVDQKKKGHSDEAARKICGAIEKKAKGEISDVEFEDIKATIEISEYFNKEL